MSSTSGQHRLLLVEDVPQIAQYIRGLLNAQQQIKLLEVINDGRKVLDTIGQLRPDVVMIDALLQGKVKGLQLAESVRAASPNLPIVVVTVPQHPVARDPQHGVDRVLSMPFSGYDLINLLHAVIKEAEQARPEAAARVTAVYAPKGGVGKTTIAFNLAVAFAQGNGARTALVDGSLQFGDLRALLKVPLDTPSIHDLPTDRIQESDLNDVLWRDPSGIDILLAPPRVELAEMISARDVEKVISMMRRVYNVVVIDMPVALSEVTLALLDSADTILEVVTWDSTTLRNTRTAVETFRAIGYPPDKIRYLLNRADSAGGLDPASFVQLLGREPEFQLVSDGRLVMESNNQGVPFLLANPMAPISQGLVGIAKDLARAPARALVSARR